MENFTEQRKNSTAQSSNNIDSLSQESATKSNAIEIPSISLPKGGGALKGIDEKFQVNSANGTAGFSIPLPVSPGRNGFSPSLALSYNSGSGNSPFGLGWNVGYPSIQRKTDKALPRYRDGLEEDIFMFLGAEDLVPYLEKDSSENYQEKKLTADDGYVVKRYRPRIEGGFARIEKIHHPDHGPYWKVTTRDNIATFFGRNESARIADPKDASRIFQWLPEFSYDDKGNWIQYHYKKDTNINDDGSQRVDESIPNYLHEKNRKKGLAFFTNTYLKRITYGYREAYYANQALPYDPILPTSADYFFELILDYGEHDELLPAPDEIRLWDYREDAFSSYRSGFEIRSNRLCKRILMFHHFEGERELLGYQSDGRKIETDFERNYLVRSLDLKYEPSSINESSQTEVNYLKQITQNGYIRKPGGDYSKKSLPPMEFNYQNLHWNKEIKTVSKESIANAPVGLTNNYQWVDLYGEGISGILTEQGEGWFYKNNLGNSNEDSEVTFAPTRKVMPKPSFTGLANGVLSLQDLEANGEKQIVVNSPGVKGYFELAQDDQWKPFKAFEEVANINLQDPNTRLIDLNGDGQPELVMTEENVFVWYAADGKRGHLPAKFAHKTFDEEKGPAIVFADQTQTIFLADMAGDGLTDIVRIRNGEICYWANMGYGNFSAKISMANAPIFDHPDAFNPQYLHLADVSGTGATDIIYLGKNTFKAFINLSGNAWSDAHEIEPFLPMGSNARLSVLDLLGTGTSCIVWSSDLPSHTNAPMRYIDLMDSKKPHVLIHYKNNMGKETSMEYKSSTHFYLKDKLADNPWITKLPFPVQVVHKSIVEEKITDVRFSSSYSYHHGYYDHTEREFRGFGRVEQRDTEHYANWRRDVATDQLERDETHFQPPVLTKTWFHTGAFLDRERILTQYKTEYWHEIYNKTFSSGPLLITEPELEDAHLSDAIKALNGDEYREALRACKGMMLRQEIFALDAPEDPADAVLQKQLKPYTVATHNCNLQLLQPRDKNKYGVFLVTESEAISISYERDETDARIAHTLNTKIDNLGNILESATVVYGRNPEKAEADFQILSDLITDFSEDVLGSDTDGKVQLQNAFKLNIESTKKEQIKTHIIYTQNSFAKFTDDEQDIDLPGAYRLRLPYEAKTYEITGLERVDTLFKLSDFEDVLHPDKEIAYHVAASSGVQNRLIEHVKTRHLKDDLTALNFGFFDTLALPYQSFQLAYSPELIEEIYKKDGRALEVDGATVNDFIVAKGNYTEIDGNFWIRSGLIHFKDLGESIAEVRNRFFSPIAFEDPYGTTTTVGYDDRFLFIRETEDNIGNKVQIDSFNYRTLSPVRMIDHNANPSTVLTDELGLVKALAAEGNGNYADLSRTSVNILEPADDLWGLTAYSTPEETNAIAAFLNSATYQTTGTVSLRNAGNTLLKHASARFVYDFEVYKKIADENSAFLDAGAPDNVLPLKPTVVASITREQHFADNLESKLHIAFEYSDGGGNVAMAKAQAEPGWASYLEDGELKRKNTEETNDLRWISNGRTVLNNKGKSVKQYEPYFSTNFLYEDDALLVETGVTPILYYDALGRPIKTELPDGTFTKVEFDSWKQLSYDQNDTVLESEWNLRRTDATRTDYINNPKEQQAALQSVAHANTPSSVYLDSLGRPVLSIAHNGKDATEKNRLYSTFIQLDIEGNAQFIRDARENVVMAYKYDMLGHRIYQKSMDAGERWVFNNVMGQPIHSWDSREQLFTTNYDAFQRPIEMRVQNSEGEFLFEKIIYGENEANAVTKNLKGQVYQHYDSSGRITNVKFDFKGSLLEVQRQLAAAYETEIVDWSPSSTTNDLEEETFSQQTEYDALGRMARLYNWHRNTERVAVYEPEYNERGVLVAEDHLITNQSTTPATIINKVTAVSGILYNEKGQRTRMHCGNGTSTKYLYDLQTYRLQQLRTTNYRPGEDLPHPPAHLSEKTVLQNLFYTYDAVGNITEIEDDAHEVIFNNNQRVEPISTYAYDAISRLISASGRENNTFDSAPKAENKENAPAGIPFLVDGQLLRNYTQKYTYDPVGNILRLQHKTDTHPERWTRNYEYEANNNRLKRTYTNNNPLGIRYNYNAHGSILNYNNAPEEYRVQWDYKERVHQINLGGGGDAWYQYDTQLERSRKHIKKGNITEETVYLGGMEVYRRWNGTTLQEIIETHHLFVEDQRVLIVEDVITTNNNILDVGILYRYQYSNHLSSVGLEVNEDGAIISYEEYHPYGTMAYQATNQAIKATAKRYRYTGMERDAESGLNYHSARYYLPWLGRWLSSDPIGIGGGMNSHAYANNNSVNLVDLDGLQAFQRRFNRDITKLIVASGNQNIIDALLVEDGSGGYRLNTTRATGSNAGHSVSGDRTSSNQELAIERATTNQADGSRERANPGMVKSSVEVEIGNGIRVPIERYTAYLLELAGHLPAGTSELPATTGWTQTELAGQLEAVENGLPIPSTDARSRWRERYENEASPENVVLPAGDIFFLVPEDSNSPPTTPISEMSDVELEREALRRREIRQRRAPDRIRVEDQERRIPDRVRVEDQEEEEEELEELEELEGEVFFAPVPPMVPTVAPAPVTAPAGVGVLAPASILIFIILCGFGECNSDVVAPTGPIA